jgi:hypothetical protein
MAAHWTEDQTRVLVQLWPTHTATQIAHILGDKSRRAVNAKASRLGLAAKHDVSEHTVAHAPRGPAVLLEWHERRPVLSRPYRPGVDPRPSFLREKHARNS